MNAILLLTNGTKHNCSFTQAQQFLRQGRVRIVKFYPLTLQFKEGDDGCGQEVLLPKKPNTPPLVSRKRVLPPFLFKCFSKEAIHE